MMVVELNADHNGLLFFTLTIFSIYHLLLVALVG